MKDNKHIDIDLDFLGEDAGNSKISPKPDVAIPNDNKNKHIDTDLGFLDNDTSREPAKPAENKVKKYNWIRIFWIIVAVLFFIAIISSDSGSSTSTPSSSPNVSNSDSETDLVVTGEFMCTQYHNTKASQLEPTSESQLELERSALNRRSDALDSMRYEIDNSTVTEYSSQWAIDEYNQSIENYERLIEQYNIDSDRFQLKIANYNSAVETYNNYLITNCDPI